MPSRAAISAGAGDLGVGPALPVPLPADSLHVRTEGRPVGLLTRRGTDHPHSLPRLGDVRARSGATLQHTLGDQQLLRPAYDVLAHAALFADLGAGGQAVSRLPHALRDPSPEFVGDAEIGRLLRHMENLVH